MNAVRLKTVLFTNLDYVIVNDVRTNTHALMLSTESNGLWPNEGPRHRVFGCGSCCAWPVFDMFVKSIEYTALPAAGRNVVLQEDGTVRPLVSGAIIQLKDGPALQLLVHDYDKPVDVEVFEIDLGENDNERYSEFQHRISEAVIDKVCAACRTPAMGGAVYLPPHQMRELLHKFNNR